MILNDFSLINTIIQIQYPAAYELWDFAGAVSRQMSTIWPDLRISEAQPDRQILKSKDVAINTGFNKATITIAGDSAFDQQMVKKIKNTLSVWCKELKLTQYDRLSTRVTYSKQFESAKEANSYLIALNLARWPESKVFDQPEDAGLNGFELTYRFEDENSFTLLRTRTETINYDVTLDPRYTEIANISETSHRAIIDFDRGLVTKLPVEKFFIEDWLKGYQHLLRRDIEKVIPN